MQLFGAGLVDVDALKAKVHKLAKMNWLYEELKEYDLNDVGQEVVETVSKTFSTMLQRQARRMLLASNCTPFGP